MKNGMLKIFIFIVLMQGACFQGVAWGMGGGPNPDLTGMQTNLTSLAASMKTLKGNLGQISGKLGELKNKLESTKGVQKNVFITLVLNKHTGVLGQKFEENGKYAAIVNAANKPMLGGGFVDGAIHAAAGDNLRKECELVPETSPDVRCPTGEAKLLTGHNLSPLRIINAVGPQPGGTNDQLISAYRNTLQRADDLKLAARNSDGSLKKQELLDIEITEKQLVDAEKVPIKTVAFSLISLGSYGFTTLDNGAEMVIQTIVDYIFKNKESNIEEIRIATYKKEEYDAFKKKLEDSAILEQCQPSDSLLKWISQSSSDSKANEPLCFKIAKK